MPNIWTHLLYAQELMNKLGYTAMMKDSQFIRVLNLGSQGPDFLFYHRFFPWIKEKKMNQLGAFMHKSECGPFLLALLKNVRGRGLFNPAVVYTLGFISHHILDRTMHPYIFAHSGFMKWKHQRFEIALDTLILKNKKGLDAWNTPVWKEIYTGRTLPLGAANALEGAAKQCYPDLMGSISTRDWEQAYSDMIRALKLFHDPRGMKRAFTLGLIEPLVYKKKLPALDYLNERHHHWNCPTAIDEIYTHSVWDLWDIALKDGLHIMEETIRILQLGTPIQDSDYSLLEELIGNVSYETGKPCSSGLVPVYVNPIF